MISNPKELPNVIFSLVKKSFTYEGGALTALAIAPSFTIKQFFDLIISDTELRSLILPLTLFSVMLILYASVAIADFFTGISASKKEFYDEVEKGNKLESDGYIDSDKLWSSVWKSLGVLLIAATITIFCLIFAVMGMKTIYNIFLIGLVMFHIVVMLFDFYSIGENQKRRFGKKPEIYIFLEDASIVIRKGIINRIGKYFE